MPHRNKIRVSQPDLSGRERQYLLEAFDSSWISSTGSFVSRFERSFADFSDVGHAISCVNGTAAMHLALLGLEIGPGDEVIVPAMTYIASANVIRYVGAEPVLADCDPNSWTISPDSISRLITPRTRAIIVVHLLGMPADMDAVKNLADDHGLAVIEDAAEAHGATVNGRPVGSLGDVSAFSFYGNKILSTGEGGMVCTNRRDLAERMQLLRGQGARRDRCYQFDEVGYNYRMTNLACAIGLAQLERFDELRARREMVRSWYDRALNDVRLTVARQQTTRRSASVLWIYGIVLKDPVPINRDQLRQRLADDDMETRPFFPALNTQRIYADCRKSPNSTAAVCARCSPTPRPPGTSPPSLPMAPTRFPCAPSAGAIRASRTAKSCTTTMPTPMNGITWPRSPNTPKPRSVWPRCSPETSFARR